jgi:hypothetical protein
MLDTWKQAFLAEGAVEVRMGRARAVLLVVLGLLFVLVGGFVLTVTPTSGLLQALGSPLQRVIGVAGLALGGVGLVTGIRSLATPLLVVRLDRSGVHVPAHAPIPWQQVAGAGLATVAGRQLVVVRASAGYAEQAQSGGGWRSRLARANAAFVEPGTVALRPGSTGSDEELQELIGWARAQAAEAGGH